jgi:DNA-binding MarR family transcriptional regulator
MSRTAARVEACRDVSAVRRFLDLVDASHHNRVELARLNQATGHPLTAGDLRALRLVAIGPTTVTGVAGRLQVDLSRASRQVAQLTALGLLTRRLDPSGGRNGTVLLADAGAAVLDCWQAAWEVRHLGAVEDWTDPEIDRFATVVARFVRELIAHQRAHTTAGGNPDPFVGWASRTSAVVDEPRAARLLPLFALVDWTVATGRSPSATVALVERARSPIGPTLIRVLGLVSRYGPLVIGELADRSGVVPSRASRHVQQLEERGLVVRAVDPHDRRSHRIKATTKGVGLLRRIAAASEAGIRAIVADWPDADAAELTTGFARIWAGLGRRATGT